jgi:predicted DsbA family dithiol-disulfide isomerase
VERPSAQERLRHTLSEWRSSPQLGCLLEAAFDPEHDHFAGSPQAAVSVVEYISYGSAIAAQDDRAFRGALRAHLERGEACLALRHFPLVDASPQSWLSACAVEAAGRQARFWDLHEAITERLARQGPSRNEHSAVLSDARKVSLDIPQLEHDMDRVAVTERVLASFAGGVRSGVSGVPTFYVQGIRQHVTGPEELVGRLGQALEGKLDALWPPRRTANARSG